MNILLFIYPFFYDRLFLVVQYLSDAINININAINIPVPVSLYTSDKVTLCNSIHKSSSICIITFTRSHQILLQTVYQFMQLLSTWVFPFSCIFANTWNFNTLKILLTWIWNTILFQFMMTSLLVRVGVFLWISCWSSSFTFLLWPSNSRLAGMTFIHVMITNPSLLWCIALSLLKKCYLWLTYKQKRKFFKSWPYNAVLTGSSEFVFYLMLQMTLKVILLQKSVRKNTAHPWGNHWSFSGILLPIFSFRVNFSLFKKPFFFFLICVLAET